MRYAQSLSLTIFLSKKPLLKISVRDKLSQPHSYFPDDMFMGSMHTRFFSNLYGYITKIMFLIFKTYQFWDTILTQLLFMTNGIKYIY